MIGKILITADVHFETLEMDKIDLYLDYFLTSIETYKPDIFCIAGDLVDDRNIKAEANEYQLLVEFIQKISDYCSKSNVSFIVLKGTISHDGEVVKNLYINNKPFIYIDEITIQTHKGMNILFIPEPYFSSYNEFYNALNLARGDQKVDLVIFHGTVDFAIPQLKQIDSKYNLSRSIVMKSSDIKYNCKTLAIGGHIHSYIYNDGIYYTNRFINQRGHYTGLDTYGIKLVEINDEKYEVTNILNPYIIKQNVINIDLRDKSELDIIEISNKYSKQDQNNIVYNITYNSDISDQRLLVRKFQDLTNAKYIKRVKKNANIEVNKVKHDYKDDINAIDLLKNIYKTRFNEELDDKYINILKGDEL